MNEGVGHRSPLLTRRLKSTLSWWVANPTKVGLEKTFRESGIEGDTGAKIPKGGVFLPISVGSRRDPSFIEKSKLRLPNLLAIQL